MSVIMFRKKGLPVNRCEVRFWLDEVTSYNNLKC